LFYFSLDKIKNNKIKGVIIMKVLVADDSKMARKMVMKVLQECSSVPCEIFQAQNGQEAVELYQQHQPFVVFLDLTMPVMDGFTALKEIKAYDANAKVIVVSADIQQGSMARVREDGAMDFVKKPINEVKMKQILQKVNES
jgi:CheY-like chemotaxis protein